MSQLIIKTTIDQLLRQLESVNKNTEEDEIEQLTHLASMILDLGAGITDKLKSLFSEQKQLNEQLLNYLINETQPDKIKLVYSSAILRYSAYYKEQLPGWNMLLKNVEQQCIEHEINAEEILVGLKD